jgi:hypothetical protein
LDDVFGVVPIADHPRGKRPQPATERLASGDKTLSSKRADARLP